LTSCSFVLGTVNANALTYSAEETSLQWAIGQAIDCSLLLKEADARLQMKLAECWQAGVLPNPAINFEFNEIRLTGQRSPFRELQASFEISQLIELGNKRSARQNVLAAEASAILWETESIKQNLIKTVTGVYADAFTAQMKLNLLKELHQNATNIVECLTEKVKNGKTSPILQRKSILARHAISVDLKKAEATLASVKRQLTLLCGGSFDCLQQISDPILPITPPRPIEYYLGSICKNTEIAQLEAAQLVSRYNYDLQRANSIPNAIFSTGLEHDSPFGGCRLCFELGFEIPVFNRNQGNISRAAWEEYSIVYKIQDLERQLTARCQDLYADWIRNYETIELIQMELIPAAQELLQIHSNREASGKEDCLERLEANKDLFDLHLQYIDAVNGFYHLKADMRFLCGTDFDN